MREESAGSYKKRRVLGKHDMEVDKAEEQNARDMCGTSRVHRVESRRKEIDSKRGSEENEKKCSVFRPSF